jgi:uncharacterized repeat protein (TIGR03803 family)
VLELSPSSNGVWAASALYDFPSADDGIQSVANLVADGEGNLYGTNPNGGTYNRGTVFRLLPTSSGQWQSTTIYNFGGVNGDGTTPMAGLIIDASGVLYGTTEFGGTSEGGTVFQLTPSTVGNWNERVLYSFVGQASKDGNYPAAPLTFDALGNIYGTTVGGGVGFGTVFKLTRIDSGTWNETILHRFGTNLGDEGNPSAGVVFDSQGNLYGATTDTRSNSEYGAIFKLSPPSGSSRTWTETLLYVFLSESDGYRPNGIIVDGAGNLLGTTLEGGTYFNGNVYELSPSSSGTWTFSNLYSFGGSKNDGLAPSAGLIFDAAGNLYGTTRGGGVTGVGTAFELQPSSGGAWIETILHNFNGVTDGSEPYSSLILDGQGNLYGTTAFGGAGAAGTVFEVTP